MVGVDEFKKSILQRIKDTGARAGVIDFKELMPFIEEFESLSSLGKWEQAKEIIEAIYFPNFSRPNKVWHMGNGIALNYALCLIKCGEAAKAVQVLSPLSDMIDLPADYYVNHSLALLHINAFAAAEGLSTAGLRQFPADKDLLGNHVIALKSQNKLKEAWHASEKRLTYGRDVHSLEEAASVLNSLAQECGERDWLQCTNYSKQALKLLVEAKELNPRFVTARFSLASTLLTLEQYKAASDEFTDVARLSGRKSVLTDLAMARYARILFEIGSLDECLAFCKEWIPKLNDTIELARVQAMAIAERYVQQKDGTRIIVPQALEFFEHAVESKEPQVEDCCYLAEYYARMKRFEEATNMIRRVENKHQGNWLIPYYMGLVEILAGQDKDSLISFEYAAKWAPFRSDPDWKMEQVYRRLGNNQMADLSHQRCEAKKAKRKEIAENGLPSS